jgi:hypothetical protein
MKLEDLATGSWMAAAAAFGALTLKVIEWLMRTLRAANKTDLEIGAALRDALWQEIARLQRDIAALQARSDECDLRARECLAENVQLRAHAEALAERVSQLEARA